MSIQKFTFQVAMITVSIIFAFAASALMFFHTARAADLGDTDLGGGWDSWSYVPDYNSTYYPDYDSSYYPDYDSSYYPDYSSSYYHDYDSWYYPSYDSSYYPDYSYDYGCGYSCGGGYSYFTPSYSSGCGMFCGGFSTPHYPTYFPQVTVGQPGRASSSYVSNTSTNISNTSTNITNIDNSINDSFNSYNYNYNSNNTSLALATPQYPVVYTSPAPYCTISHTVTSGYGYYTGGTVAYLSWTSQNATSAFLSNVGSVGVSGSQNVYPSYTSVYTLTVYGANGQTATCATTVHVNTYVPPTHILPTYVPPVMQQPYVALTQIPYTGFDLGSLGNSLYWAALLAFAAAGAYLMVYYRGGALAFATAMVSTNRKSLPPVVAPKASILVENEARSHAVRVSGEAAEAARVAPVIAALRKAGTSDTMAIVKSTDGSMPKIVIERY